MSRRALAKANEVSEHHPGERSERLTVVAYDRRAVYGLLRDWTTDRLRGELAAGSFGANLGPAERRELDEHLTAWVQRALGPMPLRDALLVDERRGRRVFGLLCAAATRARAAVPAGRAAELSRAPAELAALPAGLGAERELEEVAGLAAGGLALAVLDGTGAYPFPEDLAALTPAAPPPARPRQPLFEQPTGWRRRIAALLAVGGVALLGLPLMLGHIPESPAGAPLALLTLALLVGIKAGPAGFAGSLCIWLVANLPGFRYGSAPLAILWPTLPLMAAGLGLLWLDRRVRAMWDWLRRQIDGGGE